MTYSAGEAMVKIILVKFSSYKQLFPYETVSESVENEHKIRSPVSCSHEFLCGVFFQFIRYHNLLQ